MSRHDELLEYLGRKGCAMSRSRILEDLRWPGPELDAVLGTLMRPPAKVRAPRPGEYELVPAPLNHEVAITAPPIPSRAMETIVHKPAPPPANTEESPMARGKKTCTSCKTAKGYRAFAAGADVCNDCKGAKKPAAKPQGVREKPARMNGASRSIADIAAKHAEPAAPRGIRIETGGCTIFCGTAAEAVELVRALGH